MQDKTLNRKETAQSSDEFVQRISSLLPASSRVLEAGMSAAWHSLALAKSGRFEVSLMDVSAKALEYSRRVFERARIRAQFLERDVYDPGAPDFDLVFNASLVEQYSLERQVELIRAMATHSRRYVLVLVPKALCYVRPADLSTAFAAAGLCFCGQILLGEGQPETVAALGSISAEAPLPQCWSLSLENSTAGMQAVAAEDLSSRLLAELQIKAEREAAESALAAERRKWELRLQSERNAAANFRWRMAKGLREFRSRFDKQVATYRAQRAWRVMLAVRKAYTILARGKMDAVANDLDKYELEFPEILNYAPEELFAQDSAGIRTVGRADHHYDVIVLPIFDFEFRFQRPQQIAMQFARAGHRVFWISPTRMLPLASASCYQSTELRENVWEIRLRGEPFDLYRGVLRAPQAAALHESLEHLFRDHEIGANCAVLQFPFWRQIGLHLRESCGTRIVYDCMDDWQNWPTEPMPGAFSLAEERKLVGESDVLVVSSRGLRDRHASNGVAAELIPNATDFEFFRDPPGGSPLSGFAKPIVGYYGAIADWFDLELMVEVARSRPRYSFVLIGQAHLSDISALKGLPNVHLLGEKPYRELPGYLHDFDVCTLPFRMNRLTAAVDPVKIYEYLSQGKPVVTTPLPELAPLADLLHVAEGAENFANSIDRALAEPDESQRRKRIAFASENSWKARFLQLDEAVRATYPLVSILIVTYNTREYLGPCLDSIRRNTSYPSYEVVVVDNCSTDGAAEQLAAYAAADPRIRIECLNRNLGFAGGNNFAAQMAKGKYLVLLNPDTIVTAGWLERLLGPLEKDPNVGLIAPVSNFSGNETKVNTHYRSLEEMEKFASELARLRQGESIDIGVVPLFCGALRRNLWDEIGPLDDSFEVGMFEDDDFSLRVRNAGYRIVTAEDCFIHHFGNGSFAKLKSETALRIFEQNKNRFEAKWKTPWRPHQTRPGVRPISEDTRIALSDFFRGDGAGGV